MFFWKILCFILFYFRNPIYFTDLIKIKKHKNIIKYNIFFAHKMTAFSPSTPLSRCILQYFPSRNRFFSWSGDKYFRHVFFRPHIFPWLVGPVNLMGHVFFSSSEARYTIPLDWVAKKGSVADPVLKLPLHVPDAAAVALRGLGHRRQT